MSSLTLSSIADINPPVQISGRLSGSDLVSFIPMSDVSDAGHWTIKQSRILKTVANGFTVFEEGDVLLAKITPCMENGKGAHAIGLLGGVGFGSTEFHVLRAKLGHVQRFVFHLTKWQKFRRAAEARMVGSAGQKRVPREFFNEFCIFNFDSQEQLKLAQVLDTIDTAIQETEAIIVKLKAVKRGLLHDLMTRGIDSNGELRPPQSEAPNLYKESPLGWISKEWECVHLEEKLAVLGGKRLPAGHAYADTSTGFKYLRVTDFIGRRYSADDMLNLSKKTFNVLERYEIKPGQLYISIAGSLGHVGVHRLSGADNVRTVLTENATRLVPMCELNPEFVAEYMNTEMVQKQVNLEKGTGGGVPKLALFRIQKFNLAWPSKVEQDRISQRVLGIEACISVEEFLLEKMIKQKAGLMDDLLTGLVRFKPTLENAAQGGA